MVALLDELEQRGIAERRIDPADRRRRAVYLTDKGHEQMQVLQREARNAAKDFLEPLSADERDQLNGLLRKLAGLAER
jgi:DNA-binding MarR family transcriptional regulator